MDTQNKTQRSIKFRLVIVEKHPPHWEEKITFLHFTFEELLRSSKYWPPHYYEDYDLHGGRFIKATDEYTGLKDKNGVETYEGDIVNCKLHYFGLPTKTENFIVKYGRFIRENKGAGFYPFYGTINAYEVIESKVIGNIYENPELLEER